MADVHVQSAIDALPPAAPTLPSRVVGLAGTPVGIAVATTVVMLVVLLLLRPSFLYHRHPDTKKRTRSNGLLVLFAVSCGLIVYFVPSLLV